MWPAMWLLRSGEQPKTTAVCMEHIIYQGSDVPAVDMCQDAMLEVYWLRQDFARSESFLTVSL